MKTLLVAIFLVLPGAAQSQCPLNLRPAAHCPPMQCTHIRQYPAVRHVSTATHCQPNQSVLAAQSSTSYWPAVFVCNEAGGRSPYTVITAAQGIVCTQRHIVYGHDSAVILSGSIPANATIAGPAGDTIVANGCVIGTVVHSVPLPTQAIALGNCNCGAVANGVPSAYQASPGQTGNAIPRGPYSLSGQVRADTGKVVPNHCELEFLSCCARGGRNCMNSYIECSEITGEPIRRLACPQVAPAIDD